MQFGVEAMIPVNRDSGSNVGVIGQLHLYLDDIAPTTLGRPLFSNHHHNREADVRPMTMRFIVIILALLVAPVAASAHAMLDHAAPAVGSTVASAPKEVVLSFTEKLEPKFSSIEVRNANGAAVQLWQGRAASGTEMRVALKPLPPGTYKVIWRVLSVDTHRTNGSFSFRVGP